MTTVLKMEGITKRFPSVIANEKVTIELKKAEVHALLGENGAGKSTLMNCLFGLYQPDEGQILINGEKVTFKSSQDAIKHGIGMVHQHFMLIPQLSVTENIILGLPSKNEPFLDLASAHKEIQKLSDRYNFNIDPKSLIKDLPVGTQQRVEILKTLFRKAEIIILDEASAVLTPQEAEDLFKVIRQLADEGKSVFMIAHKLEEVMSVCDTITILRDGRVVGNVKTSEIQANQLAKMMVGRDVFLNFDKKQCKAKDVAMSVKDLVVSNKHGKHVVDHVSFDLRKGEILGIAGVDGNGQIELSEAVTGLLSYKQGEISTKEGVVPKHNTRACIERKISHIPQDRQVTGLVMDFGIDENLILQEFCTKEFSEVGILKKHKIRSHAEEMISKFNIKAPRPEVAASTLSGGNQQKIILAREMDRNPVVLIAVQPTRGLDIGATEFIRKQILEQRDKGVGVLLISTELDEILSLSDKIAVIHEGKFMCLVENGELSIEEIGLMMAGVNGSGKEVTQIG